MKKFSFVLAILLLLSSFAACTDNGGDGTDSETTAEYETIIIEPINDNYRTFYQIFVGSFSPYDDMIPEVSISSPTSLNIFSAAAANPPSVTLCPALIIPSSVSSRITS